MQNHQNLLIKFSLLLIIILHHESYAMQHLVGDSIWTIPPTNNFYTNWSSSQVFFPGDTLCTSLNFLLYLRPVPIYLTPFRFFENQNKSYFNRNIFLHILNLTPFQILRVKWIFLFSNIWPMFELTLIILDIQKVSHKLKQIEYLFILHFFLWWFLNVFFFGV